MSNLSVGNTFDRDRYKKLSTSMTPSEDKRIHFEGKSNKKYYQKLEFFRSYTLLNGGTSSEIIKCVQDSESNIGIIDGDFSIKEIERIYQIDFYSIENIVLSLHGNDFLMELMELLTCYYLSHKSIRNRLDCNFEGEYRIINSTRIDYQYYDYIDSHIDSLETFFKYMDLKKVVDTFIKKELRKKQNLGNMSQKDKDLLKEKNRFYKKYIENAKEIEIEKLFKQDVLTRLKKFA